MLEIILFAVLLLYISYWIVRSFIESHYHEALLSAGVAVLSVQIFIIANFDGQFLRFPINNTLNFGLEIIGLVLLLVSLPLLAGAFLSKRKMSNLISFWGNTQIFLAQGIYGIVRHPIHLAGILAAVGIAMMMANLTVVIIGALAIAAFYASSREEDRHASERMGYEYDEYMQAVPAFNFIRGFIETRQSR